MNANGAKTPARDVRVWPADRPPAPGEAVRTTCAHCGLEWDVHQALAGFRLRCECQAWVPVPHPLGAPARIAPAPSIPIFPAARREVERRRQGEPGFQEQRARKKRARREKKVAAPRARGKRARLIHRGLIGTLFLSALIAAPVVGVQAQQGELAWAILWPAMGGLAAILLGFAALLGRARYVVSLRSADLRHLAEGLGVGLFGGALLGTMVSGLGAQAAPNLWLQGLIAELGLPIAAVALVVLPALGHALFFREVLARRLQGLVNPRAAGAVAALALALSHGLGAFTPVLLGLALHAAWLRRRSRSSVPGLIEDLALCGVVFGVLVAA